MSKRTRHDTLFHEMLRLAAFRCWFARTHLDPADVAEMDLNRLEPMPESFMRSHKIVVPDCVLRAPLKRARGWGYIIVDQETNPNKKEVLARLEVAKARLFEYDLNDPSSEVPPLIRALIFCTGRQRWHRETDRYAALPPGLRERVRSSLGEPPRVVHASDLEESEELTRSCPELVMLHLLYRHSYEDPVVVVAKLEPLLARVLHRQGGRAALQTAIDYLSPSGGQEQTRDFILKIDQTLTRAEVKEAIMTFSEVFRHEGRQLGLREGLEEGLEKGKLEGKLEGELNKALEIARNMLNEGIPTATIARVTGLSRHKLAALRGK
ncbi:MAG: Rpn family recombination-promoting nuclease/putative transposase [Myxococcota bacterium]